MLQARTLPAVLPMVFGGLVPDIVEVSAQQGQLQLSGFVSKPPAGSSTPAPQLLYVNKCCVACPEAAKVISALYQTVLQRLGRPHGMAGATLGRAHKDACGHPAFALALTCPLSCYEVICDPNRSHVGFKDTAAVLRLLEAAVLQSWHDLLGDRLITAVQEARAGSYSKARASGRHAVSITKHEPVVVTSNKCDIAVRTKSRAEHALLAQARRQGEVLPTCGGVAAPHGQSAQGVKEFYSMSARHSALKRKRPSPEDGRQSAPAAISAQADYPDGDSELEALLQQPLSPLETQRAASSAPNKVLKRCRAGQPKRHSASGLMQSDQVHLPGRLRRQVVPPTEAFHAPNRHLALPSFSGEPGIPQQQLRCSRKLQATTLGGLGPPQRTTHSPLAGAAEAGDCSPPWEGSAAGQERSTPALPAATGQVPQHPRQSAACRPARRPEREHKLLRAEEAAEGATQHGRRQWEPLPGLSANSSTPVEQGRPPAWQQRRRAHSAPPHPAPWKGVHGGTLRDRSGRPAVRTLHTQETWFSNTVRPAGEGRAGCPGAGRKAVAQLALDATSLGAGTSTSASPAVTRTACSPLQAPVAGSAGTAPEQAANEQKPLPDLPCNPPATERPALTGTCRVEEQQILARQQELAAAAPAPSTGHGSTAARAAAPQTPSVLSRLPAEGPKAPVSSQADAMCFRISSQEVVQESGGLEVSQQAEAVVGKDVKQLPGSVQSCPDAEHALRSGRGPMPAPRVAGQSLHLQQLMEGAHRRLAPFKEHFAGSCRPVPARARLPVPALEKASARQVTLCCFNTEQAIFPATHLLLLALTCLLSALLNCRQRCRGSRRCLGELMPHLQGLKELLRCQPLQPGGQPAARV